MAPRPRRDPTRDLIRVDVHRDRVDIGQYGCRTRMQDGVDRSAEGEWRGDHMAVHADLSTPDGLCHKMPLLPLIEKFPAVAGHHPLTVARSAS